ncbi:MAG: hypothetical protein LBC68_09435 [Prevotellaceae bacterium]|jgi:hypothetical protein|nr:hypothetical protein [Prevotellaceae bacterium]
MFFEKSKGIANDFLQSVVFLDDKAFRNDSNDQYAFNAFEVSKAFAGEKKVCGIYNPASESDIECFKEIARKSDVVILDWQIEIPKSEKEDNNADEDEDDPRGKYTKPIINELANTNSLKLIIVYTGEDVLDEITNDIFESVKEILPNRGDCEIYSDNIKVLVRYKSNNPDSDMEKFKSRTHLQDKIIPYNDLPSFVLNEFTKMTAGLLSNFALLSLTTVRNNSHKILSLFSKDLDAAYLAHKAVLPVQNHAEELLVKLFGDTVTDLLLYSEITKLFDTMLSDWLSLKIKEKELPVLNKKGKKLNPPVLYKRNLNLLKLLLLSEEKDVEKRFKNQFKDLVQHKEQREDYLEYLLKNSTALFEDEDNRRINIDKRFAILTHHKSLFLPSNIVPILTSGTIIKSTANPNDYFVCIQQRCDSVRIKQGEERKFLFLPLTKVETGQFHFVTPEGTKLNLNKKSYSIKTIKFNCDNSNGEIKAFFDKSDKKYKFKEKYENGDTFEWIFDLKDLHSQRIVADYALQLSRVGLDESEWLRKAGN